MKKTAPSSSIQKLLADIEIFCRESGEGETRIGTAVMGDTSLVWRIKQGGDVYTKTCDQIYAYMAMRRSQLARLASEPEAEVGPRSSTPQRRSRRSPSRVA